MIKEQQCSTVKEIMRKYNGMELKETKGGRFTFQMYLTQDMKNTSIEALELGIRSYHALKRAGYNTIGELADAVSSGPVLKSIRNCGAKSEREIMEHMFLYQYNILSPDEQNEYLKQVAELNKK